MNIIYVNFPFSDDVTSLSFLFSTFLGLTRTAIAFIGSAVFVALAVIFAAVLFKIGVISCKRKTARTKLTAEVNLEQSAPLRNGEPARIESSL